MKDKIEYYYNLRVEDLFLDGDSYYFILNDTYFYFVYLNRLPKELDDILACVMELNSKNISVHEIVSNIKGQLFTSIDDVNYVLLKVINKDVAYDITDIIKLNKKLRLINSKSALYRNNWAFLWKQKIDYIENQLNELRVSNVINYSVDYYIGLSESAIYYVNVVSKKYGLSSLDNITLAHKRIYYPNYGLNYLNPLSFIFDLEVRDIAEYLKSAFFKNEDAFLELQTYLKSTKLSPYSYNMLFARLLFPSYYFDLYEKVVNKSLDPEKLIKIISLQDAYKDFLKKAYNEISLYASLEKINYLID